MGDLRTLGVPPAHDALYRALLVSGTATTDELAATLGAPVEDAVSTLQAMGLLVVADGGVRAAPPATAVQRLVEHRARELSESLHRTAAEHQVVESLIAERDAARTQQVAVADAPSITRLEGVARVREAIDELTFFMRSEGLTTHPRGVLTSQGIAAARVQDGRLLRRGVQLRTIMGEAALADGPTTAYLQELVAHGADVRISAQPLERILVFDRTAVMTPIDPENTALGALLTREPGLIASLVAHFERMWSGALGLAEALGAAEQERDELTDTERAVLRSLYQVDKDETGARTVGVSVRTYRRCVAELTTKLGASNRVQVAVLAKERGWL